MQDAIVIGSGIVGATITKALRSVGRDTLLLDNEQSNRGTAPSGGHLRPSWFGGMSKSEYIPAMDILDQLWGLSKDEFRLCVAGKPTTTTEVYRVDTDVVVSCDKTIGNVTRIDRCQHPKVYWTDKTGQQKVTQCRQLVVAAGAWVNEILPGTVPGLFAKRGVSFRLVGSIKEPVISAWAPYKQVVAHQQSVNEIWVGDGSAIIPENWSKVRTAECLQRCKRVVGELPVLRTLAGWRPYWRQSRKDCPCFFKQDGNIYVVTGAGKSGTIAAGWAAWRILNGK